MTIAFVAPHVEITVSDGVFHDRLKIGILAIDPSRRKTGGALLGDRIRMNAIDSDNIFMRSLATRDSGSEVPPGVDNILKLLNLAGYYN